MATKKLIAEQVQRIVNGGFTSDEPKVTIQEVMVLVEQERDALIKRHILENSVQGEHEIPSGFLTRKFFDTFNDTNLGIGGRIYSLLPVSPLNLPNDNAIYRVCEAPVRVNLGSGGEQVKGDKYKIQLDTHPPTNTSTPYLSGIEFKNKTGTTDVGNKFVFSFKHGYDANTLKDYSFTFTYKNPSDRRNTNIVNQNSLNPQVLLMSLHNDKDFQDFLNVNKLQFTWTNTAAGGYWKMSFESYYDAQNLGIEDSNHFEFKSVLTNESIVDWHADGLAITSSFSQAGAQTSPTLGFGIIIEYSKNKRLREMGPDTHNVKAEGSTTLTTYVEFTEDDVKAGSAGGYGSLGIGVMHKMWLNKYEDVLKMYGISAYISGAGLYIQEDFQNGGFNDVKFNGTSGVTATVTQEEANGVPMKSVLEDANYSDGAKCFTRMPNPGQFSMYENTMLLTGRKFWYREGNKIYFYNANKKDINEMRTKIHIWYIPASRELGDNDDFPVPHEFVPEMIKSLVATFSLMRQAKEDVVNDNIDIV